MLGETDLGFVQVFANHRTGWFHPSPVGEALMPILTGPGPALRAVGKLMRDPIRKVTRPREDETPGEWPADIRQTTQYADLVSSVDELESMELEVRDPDGVVLQVEHVGIDDMEFKKSFIPKRIRKRWEREDKTEPWEPPLEPFPRYQIQVYFVGSGMMNADDLKEIG